MTAEPKTVDTPAVVTACSVMIAGVAFGNIAGSRAALVAGYAIAITAALIMAFRCRRPRRRTP